MATDATSQANDPSVTQDVAKEKAKVEFSPEQQERMQQVINEVAARTAKEEREKASKLEAELADLKAKFESLNKKPEVDPGISKEVKNIQQNLQAELEQKARELVARDETINKVRADMAELRKRNALQQAIYAIGNPFHHNALRVVEDYTSPNIREDENGAFFVVGEDGKTPRMNKQFQRMSLPEYLAEYAAKETWLARSDYVSGAGSGQSEKSGGKTKYKAADLWGPNAVKGAATLELSIKREDATEYKRLQDEARAAGLL